MRGDRGGYQPDPARRGAGRRHPPHRLRDGRDRFRYRGLLDGIAVPRILDAGGSEYAGLLAAHSEAPVSATAEGLDPRSTLLLLFTSGSTGAPKTVICSTGRWAFIGQVNPIAFTAQDVAYNAMPIFHGNALMSALGPCLANGAAFAMRRRFSASGFLPDIRRFGATFFNYVGRSLSYRDRLRDGDFWTGDLGYRDEDGFFWFAGRTADWLRVDSENFAAAPVEQPDLGTKQSPRLIRVLASLPATVTHKISKPALRRSLWHGEDPVYERTGTGYELMTADRKDALEAEYARHGRDRLLRL